MRDKGKVQNFLREKGDFAMKQKKFEELELRDDFMFGKVMQNKAICKKTLEILLGIEIEDIEYPETQKAIAITCQGKSVRLDVYVEDDKQVVYNAEMQQKGNNDNVDQLPKRSRYYQGMIDLNLIEKGLAYTTLNKSYIVFICTFDPFGMGKHRYTFQNLCRENTNLVLEDGTIKIFFNTKGNMEDASGELKEFLKYIETNQPEGVFTKEIDREVARTKCNEKWRREYMKEVLQYFDIKEEGKQEGKQEVNRLIQLLAKQNRMEDIVRSAQDEEYQKRLLEEFHICEKKNFGDHYMRFEYTDGCDQNFISLCHLLDDYLNKLAGGEENRAEYIQYNKLDDIHDVIVAYDGDIPVGSAAYKKYDDECAEVKRVFIKKEYRGQGISKKIMELLEGSAKEKGYLYFLLESGEPLEEAMGLYRAIGYQVIPNYGPYVNMPDSVCMKKKL